MFVITVVLLGLFYFGGELPNSQYSNPVYTEQLIWWSYILFAVAIIAAVVMIVFFRKTKSEEVLTRFGLVLTFGGMIGNLVDRIFLGYVRDFIDVIIFNYNFPIFNIADMAVVIGVALIIVEIVFEEYIHGKN